jgi:hypothetical protein
VGFVEMRHLGRGWVDLGSGMHTSVKLIKIGGAG